MDFAESRALGQRVRDDPISLRENTDIEFLFMRAIRSHRDDQCAWCDPFCAQNGRPARRDGDDDLGTIDRRLDGVGYCGSAFSSSRFRGFTSATPHTHVVEWTNELDQRGLET